VSIALSVRAKGLRVFDRVFTVFSRFGLSPRKMEALLATYCDVLASAGASATLPVTATVLGRHRKVLQRLHERGIELAVHGLHHNDFAFLDEPTQRRQISAAMAIFREANIPFCGFRGPYLRSNEDTTRVLREEGFLYECSHTVMFPILDRTLARRRHRIAYGRAIDLYEPRDALRVPVRPRDLDGLIDIPVALPDDEILMDRLGYNAAQIATVWLAILERTHEARELFTLQLHPERIVVAEEALRAVLARARVLEPKVWITRVDEIARWWKHRGTLALELMEVSPDRYCVRVCGGSPGDGASIVIRGDAHHEKKQSAVRHIEREVFVDTKIKPVIGLSPRTDGSLQRFLHEEGFLFETSERRTDYGAYLDLPSRLWDEADVLAAIDNEPGPLVRLARWPNACQSALAITGDIDSITLGDFGWRLWDTWR
jgi:hypothetical protein